MPDIKEIRRRLWYSLDMAYVKMYLFISLVLIGFSWLLAWIKMGDFPANLRLIGFTVITAIAVGPFLVFCIIRTFNIFRHPESYHFCKTTLCNPKGGSIRDTIKFTVLLEDADGDKFIADTHSIFTTHRGFLAVAMEDYVNQTVTAAYNEETGQVIIIG